MSILTNRLKLTFNIDAIKQDFVFIRLERQQNDKWYGARELDYLIGKDFNAAAVMFQYGKYAYAMFKKPLDVYQLLSKIRENEEFKNNAVIEVIPKAVLEGSQECICEAWLAHILLNSLSSSRSRFDKYHYCNLTGALLLVRNFEGKNKDYLDIAKITLSSDYLLEVKTVRHRIKVSILSELKKNVDNKRRNELENALKKPHYILQESTGSLRRYLPRDGEIDAKLIYIQSGLQGKRASTPFLEFGNIDNFYKSRAGTFQHVMTSIQAHLSKYMDVNLSFREIDDNIPLTSTLLKKPEQLRSILDGQPIRIVDRVNNEESADLSMTLKELLLPYITDKKLITDGKHDNEGALNFRIIHDADYYEKIGQKDEYLCSTEKCQRQHLTIESTRNVSAPIVKTIIKEQLIKREISSRTLNLFDWAKLKPKGVWTFAAWDEDESHVIFMEIQQNGNFEFREIDGQDIFSYQEFQKYIELMTESNSGKMSRTLEGLVISDVGDINQIFCTDEISIPDISKIEAILQEVETKLPENKQNGDELADIVEDFLQEKSELDIEKLKLFSEELRKFGSQPISKGNFKSLIAKYLGTERKVGDKYINVSSTREAIDFRDHLLDKHQIRLKFPQDNQSKEDLFDASLNIKYFGETEKEAYYFVGERRENVQFSFKDACHLRKIVAVNDSKLIFRQLLPTMDVDFVRTGQSTVIPFPFKYIREYKNFGVAT